MPDEITSPTYRGSFKAPQELVSKKIGFLIEGLVPVAGITFLGGPSGHGKTWMALSIAKALFGGEKFLGHFNVPHAIPVIYLVPECGESPFRDRLDKLGLGNVKEGFLCRTLSDGLTPTLTDPMLLAAIQDLKPVVFLDTAIRFNPTNDENDSAQNSKGFANLVFNLLGKGAQAVIPLHHSNKALASSTDPPTLENTLRGTGDMGAMADAVYCVLCSDKKNFRSEVSCVKARDFEPFDPFVIQGRPYIDETQDLALIRPPNMTPEMLDEYDAQKVGDAIVKNPMISQREIAENCRVSRKRIDKLATLAGWHQPRQKQAWCRLKYSSESKRVQ